MSEQIERKKNNFKGLFLALNIILLLGLGVLYYLFFTQRSEPQTKELHNKDKPAEPQL